MMVLAHPSVGFPWLIRAEYRSEPIWLRQQPPSLLLLTNTKERKRLTNGRTKWTDKHNLCNGAFVVNPNWL